MIRLLIASTILFLLGILVTGSSWAFSPKPAGEVLDTYNNTGMDITPAYMTADYRGINASGNYVMIVVTADTSFDGFIHTYEIDSSSGEILQEIDRSGTLTNFYPRDLEKVYEDIDDDWYLIGGSGNVTGYEDIMAVEITKQGVISDIADDYNSAFVHNLIQVEDNVILASGGTTYSSYYIDPIDGEITRFDSWTTDTDTMQLWNVETMGSDSAYYWGSTTDNNSPLACGASRGGWQIGTVVGDTICSADKGDIKLVDSYCVATRGYSGTGCAAHIGYDDNSWNNGATLYTGVEDIYLTAYKVNSAYDVAPGLHDTGVETFSIVNSVITPIDYGWIYDDKWHIASLMRLTNGNMAVYYIGDDNVLYTRMIWNINDSGDLSQTMISDDVAVISNVSTSISSSGDCQRCVQMGTSTMAACVIGASTTGLRMATFSHFLPPSVTTTDLIPLETTYNSIVDASFYCGGEVTNIGTDAVTEWGFVYNTTGYPDYSDDKITTTGTQSSAFTFTDELLDLEASNEYYVRAYACNSSGTGYGNTLDGWGFPDYSNTLLKYDFEPLQISSGTVTDQSGYGHDMSFVLAPNPGSLTITMGDIVPIGPEYTCSGSDCASLFDPSVNAPEGYLLNPGSRDYTSIDGMDIVNDMIPENSIPLNVFWVSGLTVIMIVAGLKSYKATRSLLALAVVGCMVVLAACSLHWIGWWVFGFCVIFSAGILLKDEVRQAFS